MSHWQKIRDAARSLRRDVCAAFDLNENELYKAKDFLDRAAEHLELDLIPEHPDSNNLSKALAVLEDDCVYFNNHLKHWYKNFCIAHEIGHYQLHHQSVHCTREEISETDSEADASSAIEKIVGYGAGMRREREANLFALEFLLPCDVLREFYLEEKLNARKIAEKVEMPVEVVARQLARALLVPMGETEAKEYIQRELDPSQKRAAEQAKCPTLVYAGPGTGKTQTLTHRIAHLIESSIDPKRILALTFSNKAAEEMRERISRINEEAAAQIQVMTFHAYGLDILRAFWVEAELEAHSNLLDKIDALLHLEKNLHILHLEHYQSLHEPTKNLAAILGAISRAKDELCSPEEYRALAEQMLAKAKDADDDEALLKAEKVFETARVYEYYEEFLRREKLLDFGDLINRAVRLLRENETVKREVRTRYDAILVDEFQDVNRACAMLLKEIAGDGKSLWTVGDLRQSIYRWRGASPANIRLFGEDFPNAETVSLETNYRSRTEIVETFAAFAGKMQAGASEEVFGSWTANRGAALGDGKTSVKFVLADTLEAEGAFIAEQIEALRASENLKYKDCAIICRTHSQLNKFAAILSRKNIPVFYLGELFEREEVRDLLALLDLKISKKSHSLIRVAAFAEYRIPLADSRRIIEAQKENEHTFEEVLRDEDFLESLSEQGKTGAKKLLGHLISSPSSVSAWSFLAHYLFSESRYLESLFAEDNVNDQSKRLAVFQFLRLAQSLEERFAAGEKTPIEELLIYVKKLAHFNEDKNYAQIPTEAENLDAVRLLTVHSAKGLEFPAVFLPYLGKGKIPSGRLPQTCPNPEEMIAGDADFHDAEEECLFFVAASRARDFLHFSRAKDYSKNHSRFLEMLEEVLPAAETITGSSDEEIEIRTAGNTNQIKRQSFYAAELDRYMRCGRDYYYANILGLKASGDKSVYVKFHGCVYDTLRSLQTIRQMNHIELNETVALERLNEFWQAAEIDAHAYAPIYRARAEEIVRRICRSLETSAVSPNEIVRPTYEVKLENATVKVHLDAIEIVESGDQKTAIVRKYKTGKSPKDKPLVDDADILMTIAAQNEFPEASPKLYRIYLSDESVKEVVVTKQLIKNRVKKYEDAIEGINNNVFNASPSDQNCPYCPHFFICPSGEI